MRVVIISEIRDKIEEIEKVYCQKNKYTLKYGSLEKANIWHV